MSGEKRYYWLKLKIDFFKRHDIKIIESMPNGKDYVLFYLKLLLESVNHNGELRFSETIPYDENMLSIITNTNIDVVRSAMKIFTQLNMMEVLDDRTIYLEEAEKMLGCEAWSTGRSRKSRESKKHLTNSLQCNADATKCNEEIEREIDIEIEKELEIDVARLDKPKRNKFCKPSVAEIKEYCDERRNNINAEHFYDWNESKGWKVGNQGMKDWKAAVRTWETKEGQSVRPQQRKTQAERIFDL